MRTESEIKSVIKQIEAQLAPLKEKAGPFQTLSLYGILDALKWTIDLDSHLNELIRISAKMPVLEVHDDDPEEDPVG